MRIYKKKPSYKRIIFTFHSSGLVAVFTYTAALFCILLLTAVAGRFLVTWSIDVFSWYREFLNNLAGAVGA